MDKDRRYRERYEWALHQTQSEGSLWEELSNEQQQRIRDEVHRYDREIQELGEKISRGELP